jgi:hypothetical protein
MIRRFFKDLELIKLILLIASAIAIFSIFYLVYQQQGSEYTKIPRSGDYSKSKSTMDIFLQKL